jgi:hypothetical protein
MLTQVCEQVMNLTSGTQTSSLNEDLCNLEEGVPSSLQHLKSRKKK